MTHDVAASVRQRLLNLAKSKGEPFQRVLDRFVLERFLYRLSVSRHARVSLQVDIGFGDSVVPPLLEADYPTLLGHPAPKVRAYQWETAIAEKLHTMVYLGLDNSRAKDYFDLWHLAKDHAFDGELLVLAVRATFARRAMPWPEGLPEGLSDRFGLDPAKQAQWRGFLRKSGIPSAPLLVEVVQDIRGFLKPVLDAGPDGEVGMGRWASGSWSNAGRHR